MDKKSRSVFWVLFLLSIVVAIGVYLYIPALTSVTLVPILTFLVKALDLI